MAIRCAQAFDRRGADLAFVQDWLGHANTQETIIYTVLTPASRLPRKGFMQQQGY
jgi:site-specific recombinase XerD